MPLLGLVLLSEWPVIKFVALTHSQHSRQCPRKVTIARYFARHSRSWSNFIIAVIYLLIGESEFISISTCRQQSRHSTVGDMVKQTKTEYLQLRTELSKNWLDFGCALIYPREVLGANQLGAISIGRFSAGPITRFQKFGIAPLTVETRRLETGIILFA